MSSAVCWTSKPRERCCGSPCNEWGRRVRQKLEICRERDARTSSAKRAARVSYQRVLDRVLRQKFPELTIAQLSTSINLENSFGPVYARGLLRYMSPEIDWVLLGIDERWRKELRVVFRKRPEKLR